MYKLVFVIWDQFCIKNIFSYIHRKRHKWVCQYFDNGSLGAVGLWVPLFSLYFSIFSKFSSINPYYSCNKKVHIFLNLTHKRLSTRFCCVWDFLHTFFFPPAVIWRKWDLNLSHEPWTLFSPLLLSACSVFALWNHFLQLSLP